MASEGSSLETILEKQPQETQQSDGPDNLEQFLAQYHGIAWDHDHPKESDSPERAKYIENHIDEDLEIAGIIRKAEERRLVDPLTELPTREAFDLALDRVYDLVSRGANLDVYMLMVDLDKFKAVNDIHGHGVGDKVLKATGRALKGLRKTDIAARIGGEEIAILVVNPKKTELNASSQTLNPIQFAANIRQRITSKVGESTELKSQTASIGISQLRVDPDTGKLISKEQLKSEADIALYHSKEGGRDRETKFKKGMTMPEKVGA